MARKTVKLDQKMIAAIAVGGGILWWLAMRSRQDQPGNSNSNANTMSEPCNDGPYQNDTSRYA